MHTPNTYSVGFELYYIYKAMGGRIIS
jgi:hypothetical protein